MSEFIDARELAEALGLRGARIVIERAREHFNKNDLLEYEEVVKTNGGPQKTVNALLTIAQAEFICSRSRGNTANAAKKFGLNVSAHSLHRGEQFFMSIIESILDCTQLKLSRQLSVAGYLVDGAIVGKTAAILIEYDEKGHRYKKTDDAARQLAIETELLKAMEEVEFVRVDDSPEGIALAIKEISNLIHSDFVAPIEYKRM